MGDPKLNNPPIIEAILDMECAMPPGQDLTQLKPAFKQAFESQYPKPRTLSLNRHQINGDPTNPIATKHVVLHAFQFLQLDEKQIVQARVGGFSFNRLAPYSSFDDYLPEIKRTWNIFRKIASPIMIRSVQLRYINRIMLPVPGPKLDLEEYFKVSPHLPDENNLTFSSFLNQHSAIESSTGNNVNIILASQTAENLYLPVIFDITAVKQAEIEPSDWPATEMTILSLRNLKNSVFRNTLTDKCIKLFQQ